MKKNMLRNFATYEEQFKNFQMCPSITLNADYQNKIINLINSDRNQKQPKVATKRFEEYPLEGFQQSLLISGNQNNFLELMRSKSVDMLRKTKEQKPVLQTKQKLGVQNLTSLSNKSSFEQMTMRMSIKKTNQNISQLHNLTNLTENPERKLMKPEEMQIYKVTYTDNEMKNMINQINKPPHKTHIQDDIPETQKPQKQRQEREKKVSNFNKNQDPLQSLKFSYPESSDGTNSQKIEENSFQSPYFKTALNNLNTSRETLNYDPLFKETGGFLSKPKQQPQKPQLKVVEPPQFSFAASPTVAKGGVKSPGKKKITLRDYIQLNILSSKAVQKVTGTYAFLGTPICDSKNDRRGSLSKKKKNPNSNSQVLSMIKSEIGNDLKLMQQKISILADYLAGQAEEGEPDHNEIIRMYTISRMIKEKMLEGNDAIVEYMFKK